MYEVPLTNDFVRFYMYITYTAVSFIKFKINLKL